MSDFTFDDMRFKAVLLNVRQTLVGVELEPYATVKIYEDWGKGRLVFLGISYVEFRLNGNIDNTIIFKDSETTEEFEQVLLERLEKGLTANKEAIVDFDSNTVYTELSEGRHYDWMNDVFDEVMQEYLTESKDHRFKKLVQFEF